MTVRHGLKLLIDSQPDMKVVAEASDGNAAIAGALALKPDVIVIDISMPGMNGLVATRKLKQLQADAAIVTLTRHADDCVPAGAAASGRVRLRAETERSHRIAPGDSRRCRRWPVPRFRTHRAGHRGVRSASRDNRVSRTAATVSAREIGSPAVDRLGLQQQGDRGQLSLSVKTVEAHKANAMKKLGLNGRIDIMRYAALQGWLPTS